MDWATVGAIAVGTGASIVTTLATTLGAEAVREHWAERRRAKAEQRASIERLQDALSVAEQGMNKLRFAAGEEREALVWSVYETLVRARVVSSRIQDQASRAACDEVVAAVGEGIAAIEESREAAEGAAGGGFTGDVVARMRRAVDRLGEALRTA